MTIGQRLQCCNVFWLLMTKAHWIPLCHGHECPLCCVLKRWKVPFFKQEPEALRKRVGVEVKWSCFYLHSLWWRQIVEYVESQIIWTEYCLLVQILNSLTEDNYIDLRFNGPKRFPISDVITSDLHVNHLALSFHYQNNAVRMSHYRPIIYQTKYLLCIPKENIV